MNILGYFPGIDFSSNEQFGRKIHLREFISNVKSNEQVTATFVIGNAPSNLFNDDLNILEMGHTNSILRQTASEFYQTLYLSNVIRQNSIDLIYTRDSPYFAPLLMSVLTKTPLVVEANGVPENEGYNSVVSTAKNDVFHTIRAVKRRHAKKIIAVSKSVEESLLSENANYRTATVPNGVDVNKFDISTPVSLSEPYTLCYVGGLQEWQNIEKMIRVLSLIEKDIEFVIVGGTEERQAALKETAETEGTEDSITFVGRVSHDKVPELINESDVCLGPFAQARRASPLKIYEYLACGREVIVVNDEGLEEIYDLPGVHRFQYESNDLLASNITDTLNEISTNREGRNVVVDKHSWEAITDRILQECQKVVK
ncbi:glycosyltransferase [Haloarcula hispanica]|nr:glycosyltransferase [Haloarcula hispanica]MCJ0618972.1 glycosyltransferase [Haloarcula hispanica]